MNAELKLAAEGNTDALRQWLRAHPDRINTTYGVSQYTLLYTTVLHSNKVALASLASGTNIYLDTVRMLCEEFHADAGAPNGGSHNTVVHLAADMEAIEILRYLLFDYHAPLLRNVFNETPLDVAVRAGKAKAIALLKQRMSELEAEGKTTQGNNNNTAMPNNNNSSSGNSGSGSNSGSTSATPTPTRYDPTQISDALLLGGAGGGRPSTGNGTNYKQNNNINKKAAYHNKKEGKLSNAEQHVSPSGVTSGEGNATRGQGATPTHKYHKEKSERLPMMPTAAAAAATVVSAPENVHRPMRRHAHSTLQSHFTTTTAMGSTPPNMHYSLQLQPTRPPFHEEEEREREECDTVQPVTSGTPSYNNYTTSNNGAVKRASSSLGSCHRRISITDTTTTTAMDEEAPDPPRTRPSTSQPLSPAQMITTPCPPPPALPHHLRHHRSRTAQQVHQPKEEGEEVAVEALAQGGGTMWGNIGMSQTPPAIGQTLHRHVSGKTASRSVDASLSLRERVAELRIQDDDDEEEDNELQQQQQEAEKDTGAERGNTRRAVTTYDEHTTAGSSSGVGAKPLRRSATENATRHVINAEMNTNNNVRVEGENLVTLSAAQGTTITTTSQASPPLHHRPTLPNNCPSASPLHMCAGTLARHEVDWSSCTNFESNDLRSFRAAFGNAYRITACRDHCEIKGYLAYRFKGGEYYAPVIIGIYSGRPSEQSPQSTTTTTTAALYNSPHFPSTGLTLTTTSSDRADVDRLARPNHNATPNTPPNAITRNASSAAITTTSASSSSSHSYSRYRVMLNTELLGPYGIHRRAAYIDPLSKAIIVSPCDRTYTGLVAFLREAIIKNFQTMPPMVASGRPSACPFYLPIHRIDTNAESDKTATEKLMKPAPNAHVNKSSSYIRDALPHRTQAQVRRYRILQDLSRFGDGYFNYIATQHCVDGVLPIFRETSVSAQGTTATTTSSLTSSYRVLYPIVGHMVEFFPSNSAAPVHYTVPHASAANESVDVSQLKLVELLLYLRIRVQFTSLSSTAGNNSNTSSAMNLYDGVPMIFLMDGRANRFMEACFARLLLPGVNHHPTANDNSNMDTHVTPCEVDSRQLSHLLEHWSTTGSLFDLLVELRNMLTQCVKEYLTSYSAHSIAAYPSSASITSTASPLQNLFPPNATTTTTTTTMPALHSGGSSNTVVVPLNESPATAALAAFFTPTPNPVPLADTHTSLKQQQQVSGLGMQDWFATNNTTTTQGASNGMHFFSSGRAVSSHEHNMQGCDGGGLTSAQMGSPMQGHTGMNVGGNTLYTLRCVRCKREGVAKNAVLLPCYHVALCEECVAQYQNHCRHGEFACPVCYSVVRAAYALGLST